MGSEYLKASTLCFYYTIALECQYPMRLSSAVSEHQPGAIISTRKERLIPTLLYMNCWFVMAEKTLHSGNLHKIAPWLSGVSKLLPLLHNTLAVVSHRCIVWTDLSLYYKKKSILRSNKHTGTTIPVSCRTLKLLHWRSLAAYSCEEHLYIMPAYTQNTVSSVDLCASSKLSQAFALPLKR